MQNINWTQVLVFGLVALLVFALGVGVLLLLGGNLGTMGTGMMGSGGRGGGWCPWCGSGVGIGWLGSILGFTLACLLPLGFLALLVMGGVWLARNTSSSPSRRRVSTCPACGKPVEPGWKTCPYCGEALQEDFQDE